MDGDELTVFTTQAPQVLEPGTRLRVGTVVECVGSGSTGHVYRVLDELGSAIAVREYFPEGLSRRQEGLVFPLPQRDAGFEAGRKRFDEDGEHLAAIDHPGLLKVLQVWSECGTSYQAMPWCEGRTLDEVLRSAPKPPSQAQLSDWLRAMADALGPVHRQVGVHGHLSPSQLMLLDSGRLLLMELSRASRFLARDPRDIERDPYAALECGSDARYGPVGPWTDIYALAAIAHCAIRGRPPQAPVRRLAYDAQEPLLQDIDGDFDDAFLHGIDCGLALRPRSRPRDVAAFMARAGLHERRSRPRASGESLLINLHLADPGLWAAGPAPMPSAPPTSTQPSPPSEAQTEAPQAQALEAVPEDPVASTPQPEPRAEPQADEPPHPAPVGAADHVDESVLEQPAPPAGARPVEARHAPFIHHVPTAPQRRTQAQAAAGRVLVGVVGLGLITALTALLWLPSDPLSDLVLPASATAPAPAGEAGGSAKTPMAAAADGSSTSALAGASASSSPIPDPLEPTAAGPAVALPAEAASASRPDEPASEAAPAPSAAEPPAPPAPPAAKESPGEPGPVPRAGAAPAPAPRPAAPPAAVAVEPRAGEAPADADVPTSPCPGLLARQYIGRPLDAAEREQMNALCR